MGRGRGGGGGGVLFGQGRNVSEGKGVRYRYGDYAACMYFIITGQVGAMKWEGLGGVRH